MGLLKYKVYHTSNREEKRHSPEDRFSQVSFPKMQQEIPK